MVEQSVAQAEHDREAAEPPRPGPAIRKLFWAWIALWCAFMLYVMVGQPYAGLSHGQTGQGENLGWYLSPVFGTFIALIGAWIILLVGRWSAGGHGPYRH